MSTARQTHIELLLCKEFAADGHQVQKIEGNFIALVKPATDNSPWHTNVDLTRLAEIVDRKLTHEREK